MVFNIEFICRADGTGETLTLDMLTLIGEDIASVIAEANGLYQKVNTVPRPEGFRIREEGGSVVYEFVEAGEGPQGEV
jgi:hypothetical protein